MLPLRPVANLQAPPLPPPPSLIMSGAPTGPSVYTKVPPETTGIQCSSGWPEDVSKKPHGAVYTLSFLPGSLEPGKVIKVSRQVHVLTLSSKCDCGARPCSGVLSRPEATLPCIPLAHVTQPELPKVGD